MFYKKEQNYLFSISALSFMSSIYVEHGQLYDVTWFSSLVRCHVCYLNYPLRQTIVCARELILDDLGLDGISAAAVI